MLAQLSVLTGIVRSLSLLPNFVNLFTWHRRRGLRKADFPLIFCHWIFDIFPLIPGIQNQNCFFHLSLLKSTSWHRQDEIDATPKIWFSTQPISRPSYTPKGDPSVFSHVCSRCSFGNPAYARQWCCWRCCQRCERWFEAKRLVDCAILVWSEKVSIIYLPDPAGCRWGGLRHRPRPARDSGTYAIQHIHRYLHMRLCSSFISNVLCSVLVLWVHRTLRHIVLPSDCSSCLLFWLLTGKLCTDKTYSKVRMHTIPYPIRFSYHAASAGALIRVLMYVIHPCSDIVSIHTYIEFGEHTHRFPCLLWPSE